MNNIDKRDKLKEEPFSYRVGKDNKVFLSWNGKEIKVLNEKDSKIFLSKISCVDNFEAQLLMAKVTGNFKRGNEKMNKK